MNQQSNHDRRAPVVGVEQNSVLQEILRRAIRTESRVVQMMAQIGMKSDGRQILTTTRNPL